MSGWLPDIPWLQRHWIEIHDYSYAYGVDQTAMAGKDSNFTAPVIASLAYELCQKDNKFLTQSRYIVPTESTVPFLEL